MLREALAALQRQTDRFEDARIYEAPSRGEDQREENATGLLDTADLSTRLFKGEVRREFSGDGGLRARAPRPRRSLGPGPRGHRWSRAQATGRALRRRARRGTNDAAFFILIIFVFFKISRVGRGARRRARELSQA